MDATHPPIQFTNSGCIGVSDDTELAGLFEAQHALCLPQLLGPAHVQRIQRQMEKGPWVERTHGAIGHELTLADPIALHLLTFLVNRPDFLERIRRITRKPGLACFEGRVYRMQPDSGHFDSWHDDIVPGEERMVGLSINLGEHPYEGGIFRMRNRNTGEALAEIPNLIPGDARIFDIRSDLQHMVTPVTGMHAKTAFAGWFKASGVGFVERVRGRQPG